MSWLDDPFRRPIVLVEDHLVHVGELLRVLERDAPELTRLVTVVCLDRPGPDTRRAVRCWLDDYPALRIAARVDGGAASDRLRPLAPAAFTSSPELVKAVAGLLRPAGLLLQDVQLETLAFIPRERWWESIYLASTVRGTFPERPPSCRFLSNKRGYEATFGRDLVDAGFDPRDVLDKNDLARLIVPALRRYLDSAMPRALRVAHRGATVVDTAVGDDDRPELEAELDLVLWHDGDTVELGGRAVEKERLRLKPGSAEGMTWRALVADLFARGPGLPVVDVGRRVAPELAGRAEITNCAARHVHQLRSRLVDGAVIRTVEHAYGLDERLRVAGVE